MTRAPASGSDSGQSTPNPTNRRVRTPLIPQGEAQNTAEDRIETYPLIVRRDESGGRFRVFCESTGTDFSSVTHLLRLPTDLCRR